VTTKLQVISESIAKREGFYVTQDQARSRGIHWPTIPQRLNNPGDLMFAGQSGATDHPVTGVDGKVRHYAEFESEDAGWTALSRQIMLDAKRGLTLRQFINKYAPAEDGNDPKSYLSQVAAALQADPNSLLSTAIEDQPVVP
jgi:hypothetical protein